MLKRMAESEIEGKTTEFLYDMSVLDYKYVDVMKDYWEVGSGG